MKSKAKAGATSHALHMPDAPSANENERKEGGVVGHMYEHAGGKRPGADPHQGKHKADDEHQQQCGPGKSELGAMHQHESYRGQENTGRDAEDLYTPGMNWTVHAGGKRAFTHS